LSCGGGGGGGDGGVAVAPSGDGGAINLLKNHFPRAILSASRQW